MPRRNRSIVVPGIPGRDGSRFGDLEPVPTRPHATNRSITPPTMSKSEQQGSGSAEPDAAAADDRETRVLKTESLTKYFGAIEANKNVSLTLNENEILAIAGDNGAGKSTFIKQLSGYIQPTSGDIYIRQDGKLEKQYFSSSKDAMEAGVATVYQGQHLSPNASTARRRSSTV